MTQPLHLTGEPEADALLAEDPLALLIGMLLDQQIAMETAFAGPRKLADRLGGLEPRTLAEMPQEELAAACAAKPAVHRYPGAMAKRIQALCGDIVATYDADARAIWTRGAPDGPEVLRRLRALPGYGDQKARIFLALLGKQLGVQPEGWRAAAGAYDEADAQRSVADVTDAASLAAVREAKRAAKAAKRG